MAKPPKEDSLDIFDKALGLDGSDSSGTGMYMPSVYGGLAGAVIGGVLRRGLRQKIRQAKQRVDNAKTPSAKKRAEGDLATLKTRNAVGGVKDLFYGTTGGLIAGKAYETSRKRRKK